MWLCVFVNKKGKKCFAQKTALYTRKQDFNEGLLIYSSCESRENVLYNTCVKSFQTSLAMHALILVKKVVLSIRCIHSYQMYSIL